MLVNKHHSLHSSLSLKHTERSDPGPLTSSGSAFITAAANAHWQDVPPCGFSPTTEFHRRGHRQLIVSSLMHNETTLVVVKRLKAQASDIDVSQLGSTLSFFLCLLVCEYLLTCKQLALGPINISESKELEHVQFVLSR